MRKGIIIGGVAAAVVLVAGIAAASGGGSKSEAAAPASAPATVTVTEIKTVPGKREAQPHEGSLSNVPCNGAGYAEVRDNGTA